jgi:phosphinothricin acetyltransferase
VAKTKVEVRPATASDLSAINDIYNQYIAEAHYTFDLEPWTMDARREWFAHYGTTGRHRLLVAVAEGR